MDYQSNAKEYTNMVEEQKRNISDEIVDQLIELRKSKKMTQQDIADLTGMKRSNIARIEGKHHIPTIDVLVRYASCFDMQINVTLKK